MANSTDAASSTEDNDSGARSTENNDSNNESDGVDPAVRAETIEKVKQANTAVKKLQEKSEELDEKGVEKLEEKLKGEVKEAETAQKEAESACEKDSACSAGMVMLKRGEKYKKNAKADLAQLLTVENFYAKGKQDMKGDVANSQMARAVKFLQQCIFD